MPSTEDISAQQGLLAINRRNLQLYLEQRTKLGGSLYVHPSIANGIFEAREHIRRIKGFLRGCGIAVEDLPGDEESQTEQQLPRPGTVIIQKSGDHSTQFGQVFGNVENNKH